MILAIGLLMLLIVFWWMVPFIIFFYLAFIVLAIGGMALGIFLHRLWRAATGGK